MLSFEAPRCTGFRSWHKLIKASRSPCIVATCISRGACMGAQLSQELFPHMYACMCRAITSHVQLSRPACKVPHFIEKKHMKFMIMPVSLWEAIREELCCCAHAYSLLWSMSPAKGTLDLKVFGMTRNQGARRALGRSPSATYTIRING